MIAPISAPNTTRASTTSAATMPVPTVWATCNPKNRKAMKLKNAAQPTAYCGLSTRVDTTVAIEFAASCRPLRKSNASATAINPIRRGSPSVKASIQTAPLNVVDHDAVDLVRHVIESIDHFLQMVVDFVADDIRHRVGGALGLIELAQSHVVQLVRLALDLRDLLGNAAQPRGLVADRMQQRHRLAAQAGRSHDRVRHIPHARREAAHVEQHDGLGGLLHLFDRIV